MNNAIVATIVNAEDGIEAVVRKVAKGFSVMLRDTDADEYLGVSTIFPLEADAMAYAHKIAAV